MAAAVVLKQTHPKTTGGRWMATLWFSATCSQARAPSTSVTPPTSLGTEWPMLSSTFSVSSASFNQKLGILNTCVPGGFIVLLYRSWSTEDSHPTQPSVPGHHQQPCTTSLCILWLSNTSHHMVTASCSEKRLCLRCLKLNNCKLRLHSD